MHQPLLLQPCLHWLELVAAWHGRMSENDLATQVHRAGVNALIGAPSYSGLTNGLKPNVVWVTQASRSTRLAVHVCQPTCLGYPTGLPSTWPWWPSIFPSQPADMLRDMKCTEDEKRCSRLFRLSRSCSLVWLKSQNHNCLKLGRDVD